MNDGEGGTVDDVSALSGGVMILIVGMMMMMLLLLLLLPVGGFCGIGGSGDGEEVYGGEKEKKKNGS